MALHLEIAGNQIDGARDYQEDAFLITFVDDEAGIPNSTALLAMADGVGGAAAGNIASQLVTNTFNRQFSSRFGEQPINEILHDALLKSNESLRSTVAETPALDGMGCTCVVGAITQGHLWWVSVGDSHLYVIRDGQLHKNNADHSYGAYLDLMDALGTPVEPDPKLRRNMLMSAMSGDEITMIDCPTEPFALRKGDRVIICSDGLDTLDSTTILSVSAASANPKECVGALLNAVEAAAKPKQDNTTVIVCDVLEREVVEAAPPPVAAAPPVEARRDPYADRIAEAENDEAKGGSSFGKVLGAIVVLSILAAGGWFMFGQGESQRLQPTTTQSDEAEPAPTDDAPPVADSEMPAAVVAAPTFTDTLRSGGQGPLMAMLPAGAFVMGQRGSPDPAERPAHDAQVESFAIGVHEVTFTEYDRFARSAGRSLPDSSGLDRTSHPVFNVSWHDAVAYTEWLSRETGKRYTLPSEAQWEYAASAGSEAPYWWGFQLGQGRAHCFNCNTNLNLNPRLPVAVAQFEPNAFGLYDVVGNVAEWVQDCFHSSYEGAPANGSVWQGGDCSVRVARGGHFRSPTPTLRKRDRFVPDTVYPDIGFRVVREP